MAVPLPLSSPGTPSTPTTTGRRTSTPRSASSLTGLIPAHRGDGSTRCDGRDCYIDGFGGTFKQLCAAIHVCVVGLPQSKKIKFDVKDVLVYLVMGD